MTDYNGRRLQEDGLVVTWHVREEGQEASRVQCSYKFGKDWYHDIEGLVEAEVGKDIGSERFGQLVEECRRQAALKWDELNAQASVNRTAARAVGRALGEAQGIQAVLKHLARRNDIGSPEFVRIYRELDARFGVLNEAKRFADEAETAVMDGEVKEFLAKAQEDAR